MKIETEWNGNEQDQLTHEKGRETEGEKCTYSVHETGLRFGVTLNPKIRTLCMMVWYGEISKRIGWVFYVHFTTSHHDIYLVRREYYLSYNSECLHVNVCEGKCVRVCFCGAGVIFCLFVHSFCLFVCLYVYSVVYEWVPMNLGAFTLKMKWYQMSYMTNKCSYSCQQRSKRMWAQFVKWTTKHNCRSQNH